MAGGRRLARRWVLVPSLISLVSTLVFATPLRLFGLALPEPVFPYVLAFGWAALRPSMLAPLVLLALGLFLDLLWGGPLGLWPLCLLVCHGLALAARRLLSGEDAAVLWVWYAGICAVSLSVGWVATWMMAGTWPTLVGVALQWLATAALFPLAWRLIERYQVDDGRIG